MKYDLLNNINIKTKIKNLVMKVSPNSKFKTEKNGIKGRSKILYYNFTRCTKKKKWLY
jgi:hypothetical protein